jgi:drug/metabolite transporter (DMT)-like permease
MVVMRKFSEETIGVILVMASILFYGLQPIVSKYIVNTVNPLFTVTISVLFASIIPFFILVKRGMVRELVSRESMVYLFLISFSGSVIALILFLIGVGMTSGISASLLLQIEPIYSALLGFFILKEAVGRGQVFAMFLVIIGVAIIFYNGSLQVNYGDVLILATPLFYQISHLVVKKVMNKIEEDVIIAGRFVYAVPILLVISTLAGANQFEVLLKPLYLSLLLLLGVSWALGYILWIKALKRINLSKATVIVAPYPILSVILAWVMLSEVPSVYQITGLVLVLVGIYATGKTKSEKRI